MSEIIAILPPETRKLYINRRNVRDAHERALNDQRMNELKGIAAEKGLFNSGWYLAHMSELRTEFINAVTYGEFEEALETCKQYNIELTRQLCSALEDAARAALSTRYSNNIHTTARGLGNLSVPDSAIQSINQSIQTKMFSIMPSITVLIETARIADERMRAEEMAKTTPKRFAVGTNVRVCTPGLDGVVTHMGETRGSLGEYWHVVQTTNGERREPGCNLELIPEPITHANKPHSVVNYIQNVNQTGTGNSASQVGDITTNFVQGVDMVGLKHELATIRAGLKAQPESLEADEVLGALASAEKAAQSDDEHGVKNALGAITKSGWEIVKKVIPTVSSQVLLHYLKLHGMA